MTKVFLLTTNPRGLVWQRVLKEAGFETKLYTEAKELAEDVLEAPPEVLILEKDLDPRLVSELILALKENLHLAFLPVLLLIRDLRDLQDLPVDDFFFHEDAEEEVLARVELALARTQRIGDNNPLTGLPGNTTILRSIQQKIDAKERVAFCYVDLDHFKPFNDRYGFARGDEILRLVGRLLSNSVFFHAGRAGFVGHVGGDDFFFICPLEKAEEIAKEIIEKFEQLVPNFLDEEDLARGFFVAKNRRGEEERFPLPSISIAIVPNYPGRFKHYGEVASVAAQIKKIVKKIPGSAYFIDRRREPYSFSE